MPLATVTLCTRDPRAPHFARCVAALRAQTLAAADWELLVVDNGPTARPFPAEALAGLRHARVVREARPGIGAARLRAFAEARAGGADIVLMIDDDNLPVPEYLERAAALLAARPDVGLVGGVNVPRFEGAANIPRGDWWLPHFACQKLDHERFSDQPYFWIAVPPGAGMALRAAVVDEYLRLSALDERLGFFGMPHPELPFRVGGEDMMLVEVTRRLGLAYGRIPGLKQEHLLPAARLAPGAFERVVRGNYFVGFLLSYLWRLDVPVVPGLRSLAGIARRWRPTLTSRRDVRLEYFIEVQARRDAQRFWARAGWKPFAWV